MEGGLKIVNLDSPESASTIEDFIAAGAGTPTITWYNYALLQVEDTDDGQAKVHFETDNLINDYLDVLLDLAEEITMSEKEQKKYYYNPELLSFDIYGSIELDFIIMKLNGIIDPKDFDIPTIKLLRKSDLVDVMSDIFNAERKYLAANRKANGLNVLTD